MLNLFKLGIVYFKKSRVYITLATIIIAVFFSYNYGLAQTNTLNISDCGVLDQADTEYILQNDVSSDGTCFSVQANDIKLNLNGHTITYSNASPITVVNGDFENGSGTSADSWDQSVAPDFVRASGTYVDPVSLWSGSYSMSITLPVAAQSIVSQFSVTIPANRTYAVSAMVRNNFYTGPNAYIQIEDIAGNVLARKNVTNTRGALGLNAAEYKPSVDTEVFIRLGIDSSATSQSGTIYFDDVQVHPISDHGVITSACYNLFLYDNPCGGSAANMQVTNGNIVQGIANSFSGHAINLSMGPDTNGVQMDNLNITIQGPNTRAVNTAYKNNLNIHHNVINNNVTTIVSRHNMDGATILIGGGSDDSRVHDNTIIGGPQGGIAFPRDPSNTGNSAYNNDISQNGRYSNDFGIYAWGSDMLIYGNNIHPISGRGIHVDGSNNEIYDNTIAVRELKQNQEYNGCELGGSYGIQLEGGRTSNAKVYNNTVTAYADDCDGLGLRATNIGPGANNEIYGNTFSAVRVGNTSATAAASSFSEITDGGIDIHDNTFIADTSLVNVYWDQVEGITFRSNIFRYGSNLDNDVVTFFFNTSLTNDFTFRDMVFENGASDTSFFLHPLNASPAWAGSAGYTIEQTLDITVNDQNWSPMNGASVSVINSASQNEFSGNTNSSGNTSTVLTEFENYNANGEESVINTFTPHSITISASGYDSQTVELDMSQIQSLVVSLQETGSNYSCIATWSCGDWSTCTDSSQTRTCTDINSCGDDTNKPTESQVCVVGGSSEPQACSPTWDCGTWSTCSADIQTRTCVDVYSCGTNLNKPTESQACSIPSDPEDPQVCVPDWDCGSWLDCSVDIQTRICTDVYSCGDESDKPDESQSCTLTSTPASNGGSPNNSTPSVNIPSNNSGSASLACIKCTHDRGSLLVLENTSGAAVYHIGKNGKKYIFPDSKTYFTWNKDFASVKNVSLATLDDYPDGGVIAYRGGTKLITHQNTARVYAVEPGGIIRWIPSEIIAKKLYGEAWQARVQDVIPGFFAISYTRGDDLSDRLATGTLVKYNNNYYYIEGNIKRKFDNLDVLGVNGFNADDAIELNSLSKYTNGTNISDFTEAVANYL